MKEKNLETRQWNIWWTKFTFKEPNWRPKKESKVRTRNGKKKK